MSRLSTFLLAWVALAVVAPRDLARAEDPADCRVAENLIEADFPLPRVAKALARKTLDVLVVGAGSSTLPGPNGARTAYPARLQSALQEKLPGVAVKLATDVKLRRTAGDMVETMPAVLAANRPALVVWQTGTVDAMLGIDPDEFSAAVNKGVEIAHRAGADIILVNSQYSPRTDSLIALSTYLEDMRWVALQQEITLLDRFAIMKLWTELGTFDFHSATNTLDTAERVHDCIGRLLADVVVEATKPAKPLPVTGRP
ncbi:MAG TPA: SGNH/GDSL hydrolase family protein [Pseudolabrys sp.]|nr:SGNH/GDSL hydrolase family protein [Pseudolabrys sp.]